MFELDRTLSRLPGVSPMSALIPVEHSPTEIRGSRRAASPDRAAS